MTKTAELFGSSRAAWVAGILVSSILFGLAHYYKGPAGMVDSGISGLLLGTLYVKRQEFVGMHFDPWFY